MRRSIVPCACILALITGAWFGQAYSMLSPIDPVAVEDAAATGAAGTVWRFYDAIGIFFSTGDDAALRAVVAPDFVDHVDESTAASGRDRLVGYLASLRETHPKLRLVLEETIAQGDRVVAQVTPTGLTEGAILGIPLMGATPWPRFDIVRVRGELIAERWGHPGGYPLTSTLYSESLAYPNTGYLVPVLQRVTFAPEASDQTYTQEGPAILYLESGHLDVTMMADTAEPSPAGRQSEDATPPRAGHALTLGPEETLVVPNEVAFATRNTTGAPTVILLLRLVQPAQNPMSQEPAAGVARPDAGITTQALAGNSVFMLHPGRVAAELARVTLAPGMRLSAHQVAEAEFVAVDTGTVTVSVVGDGVDASRHDPKGRSTALGPYGQVSEGFGVTVSGKEVTTDYHNQTDRPVRLLLLTLALEQDNSFHPAPVTPGPSPWPDVGPLASSLSVA